MKCQLFYVMKNIPKGFWANLEKPIIGLSPMDGVTDAAYRYITCKYSKPSLVMTEFVNVEGLTRGAVSMLQDFKFSELERPAVAQIYGVELQSFYKVSIMVCHLGFDGIDINMGCPANKVARRNSGAGLIRIPYHAKKIVRICQKAVQDWVNGITLEEAGIRPKVINKLRELKPDPKERIAIPVSVKTRTGDKEIMAVEWAKHLLEVEPVTLTMHGRTLKQMYNGEANWEVLGEVAKVVKQTDTLFLGNGDIKTLAEAHERCKKYGTDGALVGRGTFGNPWFFKGHDPTVKERFETAIEHSKTYEGMIMKHGFFAMRKHLGWYCRGFNGARELRRQLMQTHSSKDVENVFKEFWKTAKITPETPTLIRDLS